MKEFFTELAYYDAYRAIADSENAECLEKQNSQESTTLVDESISEDLFERIFDSTGEITVNIADKIRDDNGQLVDPVMPYSRKFGTYPDLHLDLNTIYEETMKQDFNQHDTSFD